MKDLRNLILIIVSVCFVVSSAILSNAAQPGGIQGTGQNISGASGTSVQKPLQQPLTVNMSGSYFFCDDMSQRFAIIRQLVYSDLNELLEGGIKWPGVNETIVFPIGNALLPTHVQGCCSPQKSFSVQDQQAAGCLNNDTVKICLDKLIRNCISSFKDKEQLKLKLKESQEKSNNISIKTKQLSEQIKYLLSIMP